MDRQLENAALHYHQFPRRGKIEVRPTKPMVNQRDLSLAYSPGVAAACMAIAGNASLASEMTARANLVAVVTNGSAVLGLGNIGAIAAKPVMEGKGCLFKKFAGIDVFDIEINESDPDKLVEIIASLEPTFGGINLEDIQAPQCFYIEQQLRKRMNIPVFHDDQHGTAIIVAAAVLNALVITGKKIEDVKLVCSGGGAAAIACLDLLCTLGLARENITVTDSKGVIYRGRNESMNAQKEQYAQDTSARTLSEVIEGRDIFLGLSTSNVLSPGMVSRMASQPVVLALANPDPEILPEEAKKARPDAIIATGRSDYPNQVNNVLCFPFIFRGALDVGATTINEQMKLAAVQAIADLARTEQSDVIETAYGETDDTFGPNFLIPRPFDPRLLTSIAPAVALAAMESGVATRKIEDIDGYRRSLEEFVYRSSNIMRPLFQAASQNQKKIALAEGEDSRALRAAQIIIDEKLARPVLIGRPDVIEKSINRYNLRMKAGRDFDIVKPDKQTLIGGTKTGVRLLNDGVVHGLICGLVESFHDHLAPISKTLVANRGNGTLAAMNLLILPQSNIFITDTYINRSPTAPELADIAALAIEEVKRFGLPARAAFLSCYQRPHGRPNDKLAKAYNFVRKRFPETEIDWGLQADAALSKTILDRVNPASPLTNQANLLIMPNLEAASITFNTLKVISGEGVTVGPILMGLKKPAHIIPPTSTVRRIVNMTVLAAVQAIHQGGD